MNGASTYAKRYAAYTSDGDKVGYLEVENANNYINPNEIKQAIDAIVAEAKKHYLEILQHDFGAAVVKGAVVIDGVDVAVSKMADSVYESLAMVPKQIEKMLTVDYGFYSHAVEARDLLQTRLNENTYNELLQIAHNQGYDDVTIKEV